MSILLIASLVAGRTFADSGVTGDEPMIGGWCPGCEAVFQGIPEEIPTIARIAPRDATGEPMRITGRMDHQDGTPAPGTILYAYHTNNAGKYEKDDQYEGKAAFAHGTFRNWVKADETGAYQLDSIRPVAYPNAIWPQHVHTLVLEPGRCVYVIDTIIFKDDPRLPELDPAKRDEYYTRGVGGLGLVKGNSSIIPSFRST